MARLHQDITARFYSFSDVMFASLQLAISLFFLILIKIENPSLVSYEMGKGAFTEFQRHVEGSVEK